MTEALLSSFVERSPDPEPAPLSFCKYTRWPCRLLSPPLHNSHLGGQGSRVTSRPRQPLCPLLLGRGGVADGEGSRRWCRSPQPQRAALNPGEVHAEVPQPPAGRRRFSRVCLTPTPARECTPERVETPKPLPQPQIPVPG